MVMSRESVCHLLSLLDVGVHIIDQRGVTMYYNDQMATIEGMDHKTSLTGQSKRFSLSSALKTVHCLQRFIQNKVHGLENNHTKTHMVMM